MPKITVLTRNATEQTIEARVGDSLMEALREGDVEEVQALCGGCCSCATCHVHVLSDSSVLEPVGEMEDAMLDSSLYRNDRSRLSCQLTVTEAFDGLRIQVAPEE